VSAVRVIGTPDPLLAWDGTRLYERGDLRPGRAVPRPLCGAAATAERGVTTDGRRPAWRIVRDPLGIGKLFWAREADGSLSLAGRPLRLIEAGHSLEEVLAVPRGIVVDLEPGRAPSVEEGLEANGRAEKRGGADLVAVGREIKETLDGYLAAIAAARRGARAFVCLSGGLDSSGIAALVREHFPDAVGVSFDLARSAGSSEDRRTAARLARDLEMSLLEITVTDDELLAPLDAVLVEGIDWRDFNVHAALVNGALAAGIAEAAGRDRETALVFTGDLANEFLVDYQPERYRGVDYYELPRLGPAALRAALVGGLDSCHREVGVFAAWGLAVVQPYAVAVDAYLSLPEAFLRVDDRKEQLCRAVVGERVPAYVYSRPKARAQVGGARSGGGVLGVCVDRGVDALYLRRRFGVLHRISNPAALARFVRAGRYRWSIPSIERRGDGGE
jgi:asparagine synthetase B (glutamine-hydrolysing)